MFIIQDRAKKIDFEFESKVLIFLQSKITLFKRSSKSCSLDRET